MFNLRTYSEGAKQGKAHKGSRTDGESLTNGRCGVTCSIQAVCKTADSLGQTCHLGNATSVIRNRTISVDGERHGHCSQHTQGTKCHTKHTTEAVRNKEGDPQAQNWHDARQVAKGKTINDASGRRL